MIADKRCPFCIICKACAEKVENVVKPPQNPTAMRRYMAFCDAGINRPMMKEPMMLTDNVASSLQMVKYVKRHEIK